MNPVHFFFVRTYIIHHMIEINPDKLKHPLQAGLVAAIIYMVFQWIKDRLSSSRGGTSAEPIPLADRVRPALVVGTICALVMHLSNGPQRRTLTEPFEHVATPPVSAGGGVSTIGSSPLVAPGGGSAYA